MVFDKVGVDYARPMMVTIDLIHRPVIINAYMCVFVLFTMKAVILEVVSELTTAYFVAYLGKFISQVGKSMTIWSDHCTNFVGAVRELKDFYTHLKKA